MMKQDARKALEKYIENDGNLLAIIKYNGEINGIHYFICASDRAKKDLPGYTDKPELAVLPDGNIMVTPT